jgi:hypothetical protein
MCSWTLGCLDFKNCSLNEEKVSKIILEKKHLEKF